MKHSRMRFAWARGARIQHYGAHDSHDGYKWIDVEVKWLSYTGHTEFRVHPADEHLQYGHLSTMLRKAAVDNEVPFADTGAAALALVGEHVPYTFIVLTEPDGDVLRMFWLFMAEMLADEGL